MVSASSSSSNNRAPNSAMNSSSASRVDEFERASVIIPDVLYFCAVKREHLLVTNSVIAQEHIAFTTDRTLTYEPFYADFGPLSLGQLFRFCMAMQKVLTQAAQASSTSSTHAPASGATRAMRNSHPAAASPSAAAERGTLRSRTMRNGLRSSSGGDHGIGEADDVVAIGTNTAGKSRRVYYYCGHDPHRRANSAVLLGGYLVLFKDWQPDAAYRAVSQLRPFAPFRDASCGLSLCDLTVLDCINGIAKAKSVGFIDFHLPNSFFDIAQYEKYERVENGDLNVIVPGKFVAFSGPSNLRNRYNGFCGFQTKVPEDYHAIFSELGVGTVIRLNNKVYDKRRFSQHGFRHHDMFFVDGTCPPEQILQNFLRVSERESPGSAIAIHCKAGLGRTGTLIACYLMKHFHFTALECIAYIRICRPGSIIGPQQLFLKNIEQRMWDEGARHSMHVAAGTDGSANGNGHIFVTANGKATGDSAEASSPISLSSSPQSTRSPASHEKANGVSPDTSASRTPPRNAASPVNVSPKRIPNGGGAFGIAGSNGNIPRAMTAANGSRSLSPTPTGRSAWGHQRSYLTSRSGGSGGVSLSYSQSRTGFRRNECDIVTIPASGDGRTAAALQSPGKMSRGGCDSWTSNGSSISSPTSPHSSMMLRSSRTSAAHGSELATSTTSKQKSPHQARAATHARRNLWGGGGGGGEHAMKKNKHSIGGGASRQMHLTQMQLQHRSMLVGGAKLPHSIVPMTPDRSPNANGYSPESSYVRRAVTASGQPRKVLIQS